MTSAVLPCLCLPLTMRENPARDILKMCFSHDSSLWATRASRDLWTVFSTVFMRLGITDRRLPAESSAILGLSSWAARVSKDCAGTTSTDLGKSATEVKLNSSGRKDLGSTNSSEAGSRPVLVAMVVLSLSPSGRGSLGMRRVMPMTEGKPSNSKRQRATLTMSAREGVETASLLVLPEEEAGGS